MFFNYKHYLIGYLIASLSWLYSLGLYIVVFSFLSYRS